MINGEENCLNLIPAGLREKREAREKVFHCWKSSSQWIAHGSSPDSSRYQVQNI